MRIAVAWVAVLAFPLAWAPGPGPAGHRVRVASPEAESACKTAEGSVGGTARFVLVDSAGRRTLEYTEANLVFCRTTSATMVWIRFAESPLNDGNGSPHLDIDVCHLAGGGAFLPMEARAQPCPGGQTWGVWWHDGTGAAYANRAASPGCALHLEVDGRELRGTFACQGLVTEDGRGAVDILEGSFTCAREDPAPPGAGT